MHKVVVAGCGLTGLTLSLLLARKGVKVLVLDEKTEPGQGSRAICFSKRTLEIFDKTGVAGPIVEKGVQWSTGRIFSGTEEVHSFDLLPKRYSKYPAFVNISQYEVERLLIEAVRQEKKIELQMQHRITDLQVKPYGNELTVQTPDGEELLACAFLVACDGSRSSIRRLMNLEMSGARSEEKFLIIDFRMDGGFPPERWFWFAPPHNAEETILLHKQPDNIWRLDVQLGRSVQDDVVNDHAFICSKVKQVVGDKAIAIEWVSLYSFSNKMLDNFIHKQVIFAGDAAHVFSPFGARGANSGIQDADNLAWKLNEVLNGDAPVAFLQTYNRERLLACRQNITCTTQSALFISPPTVHAGKLRNAILLNARHEALARKQINCGRLSVPNVYGSYAGSEEGEWTNDDLAPGNCLKDCLLDDGYLAKLAGHGFTLLTAGNTVTRETRERLEQAGIGVLAVELSGNQVLRELYELSGGAAYLFTPDQYILGRWKNFEVEKVIGLKILYFSGNIDNIRLPSLTEQEQIDAEVARLLRAGI